MKPVLGVVDHHLGLWFSEMVQVEVQSEGVIGVKTRRLIIRGGQWNQGGVHIHLMLRILSEAMLTSCVGDGMAFRSKVLQSAHNSICDVNGTILATKHAICVRRITPLHPSHIKNPRYSKNWLTHHTIFYSDSITN